MKPILDACCGGRMFYFDKNNPNVLFTDIWCDNCGNMILGYGMSMMAGMFFVLPIGNHSRHHQQNNQRPQKCGLFLRRIYETI